MGRGNGSGTMQLGSTDIVEMVHGLKATKNSLTNAGRLGGALELEEKKRKQLSAQVDQLLGKLAPDEGEPPTTYRPAEDEIYASRVALRHRHGQLKKLEADERKRGVSTNPDLAEKVSRLEELGRSVNIQLDAIDHGGAED